MADSARQRAVEVLAEALCDGLNSDGRVSDIVERQMHALSAEGLVVTDLKAGGRIAMACRLACAEIAEGDPDRALDDLRAAVDRFEADMDALSEASGD